MLYYGQSNLTTCQELPRVHGTRPYPRLAMTTASFALGHYCSFAAALIGKTIGRRNHLIFKLPTTIRPKETTSPLAGPLAYPPNGRPTPLVSQRSSAHLDPRSSSLPPLLVWTPSRIGVGFLGWNRRVASFPHPFLKGTVVIMGTAPRLDPANFSVFPEARAFRTCAVASAVGVPTGQLSAKGTLTQVLGSGLPIAFCHPQSLSLLTWSLRKLHRFSYRFSH